MTFSGDILVNHDYHLIYIAIPKCANSSLKSAFIDNLGQTIPANLLTRLEPDKLAFSPIVDPEIRRYMDNLGLLVKRNDVIKRFSKYHRFAVLREPSERLYSCWRDKIQSSPISNWRFEYGVHRGFSKYGDKFWAGMTFAEFVMAVTRIPNSRSNPHFRSQSSFIIDHRQRLLPTKICTVEHLESSLDRDPILEACFRGLSKKNVMHSKYEMFSLPTRLQRVIRDRYDSDYRLLGQLIGDNY